MRDNPLSEAVGAVRHVARSLVRAVPQDLRPAESSGESFS